MTKEPDRTVDWLIITVLVAFVLYVIGKIFKWW